MTIMELFLAKINTGKILCVTILHKIIACAKGDKAGEVLPHMAANERDGVCVYQGRAPRVLPLMFFVTL